MGRQNSGPADGHQLDIHPEQNTVRRESMTSFEGSADVFTKSMAGRGSEVFSCLRGSSKIFWMEVKKDVPNLLCLILKPYYILIELLDPISLLDRNFSLFNYWGGRARTCSLLIQSQVT